MSKLREIWWGYAKNMIRQYPRLQAAEAEQQLTATKQREIEAVKKAVEITQAKETGKIRMAVVDFVLWKKMGTTYMAAVKLFLSKRTAERYHHEFIHLVAECYGLTK